LNKISNELATTSLHENKRSKNELPNFYWDRLIRDLVLAGYGDYEAAANADMIDAAVFLLLGDDRISRAHKFVRS